MVGLIFGILEFVTKAVFIIVISIFTSFLIAFIVVRGLWVHFLIGALLAVLINIFIINLI